MTAVVLFFPALACQIFALAGTLAMDRRGEKRRARPGRRGQKLFLLPLFLVGAVGVILYALSNGNILLATGQSIFMGFCIPVFMPDRTCPDDTRDTM